MKSCNSKPKRALTSNTLLVIFFLFLVFPISSLSYSEVVGDGGLSVKVLPANPRSFTNTSIQLTGYGVDLDKSNIAWEIDGKKERQGVGQKSINFLTGAVGKNMLIKIDVFTQDGRYLNEVISIVPAEVEILWQSDSYIPPFYRGKSLATKYSNLKIVALPNFTTTNGSSMDASNLFYKWKINSEELNSGYGRTSVIGQLDTKNLRNTVSVDVSTLDDTIHATHYIQTQVSSPLIIFYENSPLLGVIHNKSIPDNFFLNQPEITIEAEPYFSNKADLSYFWGINDEPLTPSKNDESRLIVRQPPSNSGESTLNMLASSPFQSLEKSITIKFGQTTLGF
jgi:hypothetical protein